MSPNQIQKLQAARAAALETQSPHARGQAKILDALNWIYHWGWSCPKVINLVAQDNRNGLVSRLVQQGLVTKTPVSVGGLRDIPTCILTLTEAGIALVEKHIEHTTDLLPYSVNPLRIPSASLRHDFLAQHTTAKALIASAISGFCGTRKLNHRSEKGCKQPDAIWLKDDFRMALEIELTAKWARILDQFVLNHLNALATPKADGRADFDQILLLTDSKAIMARYKQAFTPGATLGIWQKDANRHWTKIKTVKVPDWMEGKLICKLIET